MWVVGLTVLAVVGVVHSDIIEEIKWLRGNLSELVVPEKKK